MAALKIYNTMSRKKEVFKPLADKKVGLYTCGPTVYWYAHIGNLRTYIFEDILKRVLLYNGYKVKHVMNITDVGHLTSNADTGEEKMELAAKREHKSAWEIAKFYESTFFKDIEKLNIIKPDIVCKATDHIKEQIDLIKKLEKKGFTYVIKDGVYFNTAKLKDYGKLAKLDIRGLKAGARIEVVPGKKRATDFALWKFSPQDKKREMEWDSPWRKGFPGWHIECSAMAMKYLGETFDIHCGGIDHIPVHHTNEIAQSEAATGKKFVNYWLHGAFLQLKEGRMGKSEGNIILVDNLEEEGFDPLAYRYLVLTSHYRSALVFTKENLRAAQTALDRLRDSVKRLQEIKTPGKKEGLSKLILHAQEEFERAVNDDLEMPRALATINEFMHSINKHMDVKLIDKARAQKILELLYKFDSVLGLKLGEVKKEKLSKEILDLIKKREEARQKKDFKTSDKIRDLLKEEGIILEDLDSGTRWRRA
ncbi:MAG TPA: cysteine--tRNA ligase [Candidatus Nanoarchaeia archaeon]|nr:cysteine--tRNA ligase [Candidatus Nanoarchaeia archaeon]